MAGEPRTTSAWLKGMQLLGSQLSVKYTSEPRETEWTAGVLLAWPQSRLLKVAIEIPLRSSESFALFARKQLY